MKKETTEVTGAGEKIVKKILANGGKVSPSMFPPKPEPSDRRKAEAYEEWRAEIDELRSMITSFEDRRSFLATQLKAAREKLDALLDRGPSFEKQDELFSDDKGKRKVAEYTIKVHNDGFKVYNYECPYCKTLSKVPDKPGTSEKCTVCGETFDIIPAKPVPL